ncbi:tyrosine-type recombinase/integrase [Dermatophilaceae bacterium Soc4.6]
MRRLPSKRWQASYIGPDLARHFAPSTYASKGDAEGWLGAERGRISADSWAPPGSRRVESPVVTFEAFAAEWVANRPLKPRTREGYNHLLRGYLVPAFGAAPMTTISPTIVRRWWRGMDPTTPTINARAYALLRAIFSTAVEEEVVASSPCRIRGASISPRVVEIRPATVAELETIVAGLPANRQAVALLCAWCALRIGEALELRRGDLDLPRGQLTVGRAVSWLEGGPVVGTPKSRAGMRTVAIPPHITDALARHLAEFVGPEKDALLFTARDGTSHLQPSVFQGAWRKARAAAGREDLRVHDLRHTGATMAAMTGATLAELQQRLGHSSVNAALRYQHAAKGRDAEIAKALSVLAGYSGPTA